MSMVSIQTYVHATKEIHNDEFQMNCHMESTVLFM